MFYSHTKTEHVRKHVHVMLCFVDRAFLYNFVNKAKLVHKKN
jgi:hypothetical protein